MGRGGGSFSEGWKGGGIPFSEVWKGGGGSFSRSMEGGGLPAHEYGGVRSLRGWVQGCRGNEKSNLIP